jgi:F0F1-type ATP synthase assembly protein I
VSNRNGGVPPGRLVGLGIELAAVILAGTGIGYLLDVTLLKFDQPWGLIAGCFIGFAVGMANIVRVSRTL